MAKIARRASREEITIFLFFDASLGEVHEVMTLASDAPGSLFGELEKITQDSGHHSYLVHEVLLFFLEASVSLLSLHLALLTKSSRCGPLPPKD